MPEPAATGRGGDPTPLSVRDVNRAGPLDADVAVGLLQRAQALADQGDWDIAAGTFARVVGTADAALHTAALLGLAECRYRLDDEPSAIQAWISATQAPENPLTWRAWKALAASRVRSSDVAGAARAYREAARRAPPSEQAELQSRIGWLSKELGDTRGAERAFTRTRAGGMAQPVVTYALLAGTIAVGISMFLLGQEELWLDLFALDKQAILVDGEYWRLITPVLVHGSILHLLFNMYALWIIGPIVEALYGPVRYLSIYLLCGAAGSAASYMFSDARFSVGASGAVFGLFGALLVADRVYRPALTRNARNLTSQIGILIAINLFIGVSVPNIDNAAHIGGLIAGAWLGLVMAPRGATRQASLPRRASRDDAVSGGPLPPSGTPPPNTTGPPSAPTLLGRRIDATALVGVAGVLLLLAVVGLMVAVGPLGLP